MDTKALFAIAVRNLGRSKGRYATLTAAIALGCAIMTLATGAMIGMRSSLQAKAGLYYGGDFSVHGLWKDGREMIPGSSAIASAIEEAGGGRVLASPRIVDRSPSSFLFFAGASIRLKMITGVHWKAEGARFRDLNFIQGGTSGMEKGDGVLVSEPVARALGARPGDDILILTDTAEGQRNTATAILAGVFRDSSFLAADTAYVGFDFLKSLTRYPDGASTEIGVHFAGGPGGAQAIAAIQKNMEKRLPMFPLASSRAALFRMQDRDSWEGVRYAILSLAAHVRQISQVVDILAAALYAIVAVLLGVIVLGVTNTYRVIVQERTREIGTMRALGMQRSGVARLFLAEAACLVGIGTGGGLVLGLAGLAVLGSFSFSWIPGFDVFLSHGRIAWSLNAALLSGIVALMFATCLAASWAQASRAARVEPAAAYVME